jgi:outer membrane protein assembly factor BamE
MQHARLLLLSAALPCLLSACSTSSMPTFLQPYQMDINQGNILDDDKMAQLKLGMSKEQVRFIVGTPMLDDMFHANRWDYIYFHKAGKDAPVQRKFALFFDANGKLERSEPPLSELSTLPLNTL